VKPLLFVALAALCAAQAAPQKIAKEVKHELVMLPGHGVFDNLNYRVDGTTVTLLGQVTNPALKSSAAIAVKKIEGVANVDNQIEILPDSATDDRIRNAAYRALYSKEALNVYQLNAVAPIHIIVKNANVTLIGAVKNETDKNLAGAAANGVLGVAKVTNNLAIQN
jgi:hyperosmotically inducible periplasmic protein